MFKQFYENNSKIFADVCDIFVHSDKLKNIYANWEEALFEKTYEITRRDEKRFNVLNHGDMWSNNMMFHYNDSGRAESCLLVDYQIIIIV